MSSTKEDGAAAAAEQLGSMTLGESVERKDNDAEPTTKNGTPPSLPPRRPRKQLARKTQRAGIMMSAEQLGSISLSESETVERKVEPENSEDADTNGTPPKKCSACGEKGDTCTLKKCTACKCVWYCDKHCQNRHWKEHKIECKPIKKELAKRGGKLDLGTELDLGPLPDLPSREECPICMRTLPIHENLQSYSECCGKILCRGCIFQHLMKSGKWADAGQTQEVVLAYQAPTCAFCRTAIPRSDEESLARIRKRVERNDPCAMHNLAIPGYRFGINGLPVDDAKCVDLLRQSAGLGFPTAQYQLGNYQHDGDMGLEQNEEEAIKYWEKAAEGGHLHARHNLGCAANEKGDRVTAMRHWRLSASGGLKKSMYGIVVCFKEGLLHHGDLAKTLRAFYQARAELRSEERDKHIEYLKRTGEYDAKYEC